MIEGLAFRDGDGRAFLRGPYCFRPALQQEYVFAGHEVATDGPLDVLRTAVVTFDPPRNLCQRVDFVVAQASDVLVIGRNFFVDNTGSGGIRSVLTRLG